MLTALLVAVMTVVAPFTPQCSAEDWPIETVCHRGDVVYLDNGRLTVNLSTGTVETHADR